MSIGDAGALPNRWDKLNIGPRIRRGAGSVWKKLSGPSSAQEKVELQKRRDLVSIQLGNRTYNKVLRKGNMRRLASGLTKVGLGLVVLAAPTGGATLIPGILMALTGMAIGGFLRVHDGDRSLQGFLAGMRRSVSMGPELKAARATLKAIGYTIAGFKNPNYRATAKIAWQNAKFHLKDGWREADLSHVDLKEVKKMSKQPSLEGREVAEDFSGGIRGAVQEVARRPVLSQVKHKFGDDTTVTLVRGDRGVVYDVCTPDQSHVQGTVSINQGEIDLEDEAGRRLVETMEQVELLSSPASIELRSTIQRSIEDEGSPKMADFDGQRVMISVQEPSSGGGLHLIMTLKAQTGDTRTDTQRRISIPVESFDQVFQIQEKAISDMLELVRDPSKKNSE